jgi:hypothetical protein
LQWASDSEQVESHKTHIEAFLEDLEAEDRFDVTDEDGLFFMNYKSFRLVFNKLFVANDFPDKWWAVRYESNWGSDCSGGLPVEGTAEAKIRYAKNPQYLFQPVEDCELFVSLG